MLYCCIQVKGTVRVILSEPLSKDDKAQITTVLVIIHVSLFIILKTDFQLWLQEDIQEL